MGSPEQAPPAVHDLAEACVRYVERALGVKLDYSAETLPLLDHYLADGRAAAQARPETVPLLAQTAGAYFGEVVRRRHASAWETDGDDPAAWELRFEDVDLAFSPVEMMRQAILVGAMGDEPDAGETAFELDDEDREAVHARLAELPPVPEDEFYAPSTRLEIIDIVVDAVSLRHAQEVEDPDPSVS